MALEIRSIPILTGETAERFVREAEENDSQKESLKAGVVVGYASSKLWKDGKD